MRPNFIIVIILLIFYSCNTKTFSKATKKQEKEYVQETKEFIKYIRTIEYNDETILLVDKPDMKEFIGCIDGLFRDTTLFNKNEQEAIKSQISNPLLKKWDVKLVEKANTISIDSITLIFKDINKGWTFFYKNYGKSYISYSAPIFLKNYTLCLFYSDHSCGRLCGSGQITLFKKEGSTWKPLKHFCDWVS